MSSSIRQTAALIVTGVASLVLVGVARAAHSETHFQHEFNKPCQHFDYAHGKAITDAQVEVAPGTALLDATVRQLYEGDASRTITLTGGPGRTYDVQAHPIIPIAGETDVLVYVWGFEGSFRTGGQPGSNYSGFIRRSAITKVASGHVPSTPDRFNRVSVAQHDELRRKFGGGTVTVVPHPTTGTYSSAHHALSDYGYAHGRLADFCYGALNLPGHTTNGGVTGLILHKGETVYATRITLKVRANQRHLGPRNDTFVLCLVTLPGGQGTRAERMAVWVALADLPSIKLASLQHRKGHKGSRHH